MSGFITTYAQEIDKDSLIDAIVKKVNSFQGQRNRKEQGIVSPGGFLEIVKQVFARVVVKNDDLVKNGTATSLVVDPDKSTISGNVNFKVMDFCYWNVGLGGNTESQQLSIFKGGGYNKGFTISTSLDFKLPFKFASTIFYHPDSCDSHLNNRAFHLNLLAAKLQKYRNVKSTDIEKRMDTLANILFGPSSDAIKLEDLEAKKKEYDLLKDSLQIFKKYLSSISGLDSIDKEVADFELKNAPTNGYKLHWVNLGGSFSNQSYNIFDTSLTNPIKDTLQTRHYQLFSFQVSYNWIRNAPKSLFYIYATLGLQKQYGLQGFTYSKTKNELTGEENAIVKTTTVEAINVSQIHDSYNEAYWTVNPEISGFWFFGKNKIFGVEFMAAFKIKNRTPDLIEYRPSGSFRIGPLFSMSKSSGVVSTGTIGLLLTANNMVFSKNNLNDVLGFTVRLGIPFANLKAI